jgi:uncharacterized protein with GYD domain
MMEEDMAKYIALINWTDKGIKDLKESPARADKAREMVKKLGGEFQHLYMTMGAFDLVAIIEMPNDEAMAKFALMTNREGYIRTKTLKAFDEAAYRKLIGSL